MVYGVWSMVGIGVRGMAEAGCYWVGLEWRYGLVSGGMGWSVEVQGISNPDCNTLLRQNPARLNPEEPCPMTVPIPHPGLRGMSFGTISYASLSVITRMTRWRRKQPVNHPKNLSTKTRIIGCIYSGKFGTEVTASVMGSCHHPNMVTPQRVKPEMTVSKS
mgnify:CR=1 FL=1